jgi:hypothetical protein
VETASVDEAMRVSKVSALSPTKHSCAIYRLQTAVDAFGSTTPRNSEGTAFPSDETRRQPQVNSISSYHSPANAEIKQGLGIPCAHLRRGRARSPKFAIQAPTNTVSESPRRISPPMKSGDTNVAVTCFLHAPSGSTLRLKQLVNE